VNTYFVSKAARDAGLTVALSGLGADELFGGYTSFSRAQIVRRVMGAAARIPGHQSILPRLATLPGLPYRVRRSAAWAGRDPSFESAYLAIRGLFAPGELHTLMPGLNGFDPHDYVTDIARTEGLSPGPAMSLLETRFYMHNQLLRDTDAMSMAHSLEVRVPYLDNVVAAVAAGAQAWLDRPDKPALRAARAPYFPDEVDRPKRGFSFPFPLWLKSPEAFASSAAGAAAVMPTTAGWERVRRDFEGGRRDWSHVWAPLLLSRWLEAHRVTV
jgi:asparagine synthase (glutamine-hydrolysing)